MHPGERFNSFTHLAGVIAAIVGAPLLVWPALLAGQGWKIAGLSIYAFCLIALYLFSTLYHSTRGQHKALFRHLDHLAIYLLIAGTYTPFLLVTLRGKERFDKQQLQPAHQQIDGDRPQSAALIG